MLRIEKVIVICREVNRQTGQIAVYHQQRKNARR